MAQSGNGESLINETFESSEPADRNRRRLLNCIDRVLAKLGSDVRRALTYYMRRQYALKRYEIPDKPHEFSLALHHIFGVSATGIERDITNNIVAEFQLNPEMQFSFETAVRAAISHSD